MEVKSKLTTNIAANYIKGLIKLKINASNKRIKDSHTPSKPDIAKPTRNTLSKLDIAKLTSNRNKRMKASHTLEMTFYIPIILFTVFTIIYLVLISHDRLVLSYAMRDTLIWSSLRNENGQELSETMIEVRAKNMEELLFLVRDTRYTASISNTGIKLSCKGASFVSFIDIAETLDITGVENFEINMNSRKPESLLRLKGMID